MVIFSNKQNYKIKGEKEVKIKVKRHTLNRNSKERDVKTNERVFKKRNNFGKAKLQKGSKPKKLTELLR